MALAETDAIPPAVLVEGLVLHLDVTDCPEQTAFQAWQLLADTISALAGAVVSLRTRVGLHVTLLWAVACTVLGGGSACDPPVGGGLHSPGWWVCM